MQLNEKSSNALNYLKCILCIGVVFIHARYYPDLSVLGIESLEDYYFYNTLDIYFNARFLNCTCVPLFFIISGYLFFLNIPAKFEFRVFKLKWKSRIRSLLIPYLICNSVILLLTITSQIIHDEQIKTIDIFTAFWSYNGGYPIMMPSWYLRDLMVVCLCSPLIWALLKYTKYLLLVILCFFWFIEVWIELPGFGIRSFLFFSIGSFIGMRREDLIEMVNPPKLWPLWCLFFGGIYCMYIYSDYEWLHKFSILLSFPLWICFGFLISYIIDAKCKNTIVTGSFFVFLYHFSIAHRVPVYLTVILGVSESSVILSYILGALLTSAILLSFFHLGRLFMPKVFKLVVGGR